MIHDISPGLEGFVIRVVGASDRHRQCRLENRSLLDGDIGAPMTVI
jgi:hypothetical protein